MSVVKQLFNFEILNAMSGGAFENASIFALSVTPYITAQIIIQLLAMDIVPYLAELSKQGGVGQKKMNQITRVVGIILGFIQGYMYSFAYISNGTPMQYMLYALILTAGTALLWYVINNYGRYHQRITKYVRKIMDGINW